MRASENRLVFGTIALFVSIVAIGFVYAGFTGTLKVNGTGNVMASKWDIYFANLSNAVTTGTANVVTPATISPKTKIGDYYVELATPGDSVTYTFDVVNDGDFDAVLTTLSKSTPTCTPSASLCNYLTYSLKYTSNNQNVAENDTLLRHTTKNMTLKLELDANMPASALSSTELSVNDLGITLLYSQASGYNGADSTADEVTPPTIGLSNNEEIQVVTAGTSTFDVDHYEYYFSTSSEEPDTSTSATGTTNGTISVSNYSKTEYPQFYIWYRTVSTHGNKSVWSNGLLVSQKFTVTLDANGGTIPVTSGWTNGSGNSTSTKTIRYGSQYGNLPTPTQNDCYFNGWEGNILDVYDLTDLAKNYGIAINSSRYVYDTTPTTDSRYLNAHDGGAYSRSNWFVDISPRTYTIDLNMVQIATISEGTSNSDVGGNPWISVSSAPLIENNYFRKNIINETGVTKEFTIDENKTLGIALKVYDGIADIKLNTYLTSSDIYNLRYDTTLTAKWRCSPASVNGVMYDTLQAAINNGVPDNGTKTLVTILRDIDDENITIPTSKNIELDINGYTISNNAGIIIENKGILEIKNGSIIRTGENDGKQTIINTNTGNLTITSGEIKHDSLQAIQNKGTMTITGGKIWLGNIADQGVINNESGALISISGGQIIGTYRQALYNNGGTVNISGNAFLKNGYDYVYGYLSNKPTRSCLQNASGTMNITGGTIITPSNNSKYAAVENNGTMTIGNNNGVIDTTTPVIRGNYYGLIIKDNKTVSYYDGIIGGLNAAVNVESRLVLDATNNVGLNYGTETIGSDTYNTITLTEQSGN